MTVRFSVININHNHINSIVDSLLKAGAAFISFYAPEDDLAALFAKKFPQAARVDDKRRILGGSQACAS